MVFDSDVVCVMAGPVKFRTCTVTDFPEGLRCVKCRELIDFGAAYVRVPGVFKSEWDESCVACALGKVRVDVSG